MKTPQTQLTPRAQQAIAKAKLIAEEMGHNYIGTEHLLLAIWKMPESSAGRLLDGIEMTYDEAKDFIEQTAIYDKIKDEKSPLMELADAVAMLRDEVRKLSGRVDSLSNAKVRNPHPEKS
jgi:ATP-dependent Clp protease ATP-binding subunit ClpA